MSKNNARDKELMKQSETECGFNSDKFADLIRQDEREECAKVAALTVCDTHIPTGIKIYGTAAAKAIMARGNT